MRPRTRRRGSGRRCDVTTTAHQRGASPDASGTPRVAVIWLYQPSVPVMGIAPAPRRTAAGSRNGICRFREVHVQIARWLMYIVGTHKLRYCNIDYVLCSAIQAIKPPSRVVVSYDIGCQYSINFDERMKNLPEVLRIDTDSTDVAFGLPVWHGGIHEELCRSKWSLKHLSGVGRTDGEGIERIWALMNAWAWATKEMGQGARHGWIDEKGDSINFLKNIQQGTTLLRRLVISMDERDIQVKAFKAVNDNVDVVDRREWKRTLRQWEKTREGRSPFAMPQLSVFRGGVSEAEVCHQLDAEEMEAVKSGEAKVHGISQTSFLFAGLQLEAAQRRILADLKGPAVIPMNLEGIINSRRRALLVKLEKYHDLQKLYMPGLATYLESRAHFEPQAVDAELVPLHLPSSIPSSVRSSVCADGLPDKELKLRNARSNDTIDGLRKKLHAKQYHIEFRNKHVTGQRSATRHCALVATLQDKLEFDATTYRVTRQAILNLSGLTERDDLPELRPRDLQLEGEMDEPDAAAMARYAGVGATQRPRHIHVSTGKHQMSWLWTARGSTEGPNDEEVRQMIGCLWLKALARKARWTEEVELLWEDMQRCLRSLEKESSVWRARALALNGRTVGHNSGMAAYALRQAAQWTRLRDNFLTEWNKPYGKTKPRGGGGVPHSAYCGGGRRRGRAEAVRVEAVAGETRDAREDCAWEPGPLREDGWMGGTTCGRARCTRPQGGDMQAARGGYASMTRHGRSARAAHGRRGWRSHVPGGQQTRLGRALQPGTAGGRRRGNAEKDAWMARTVPLHPTQCVLRPRGPP
ncbi:hypothetical protein BD626DRAFT_541364 [Schizophyllum amplum]|uniref:Uncharacterized protein n=1 Tax=Schizophyllum amplum TaxID=97359 RepID=A0A550BV01_9AGAR|nr:hypothetical protein BD626DRAFT_541364 [Auriculariopsis ampla]